MVLDQVYQEFEQILRLHIKSLLPTLQTIISARKILRNPFPLIQEEEGRWGQVDERVVRAGLDLNPFPGKAHVSEDYAEAIFKTLDQNRKNNIDDIIVDDKD